MCLWNNSFQLKIKPKYFQESLGRKIGPLKSDKSRRGGLKVPWFLLKWKTSVLECSIMSPKLSKRLERMLYPQNKCKLEDRKNLSWTIKSPLSTKERMEIGILRFLNLFSKMYRSGDVVATTYHKGQIISLTSKPQKKYDVGIHKRTRQGVSAKLESYIYKTCLVRATNI